MKIQTNELIGPALDWAVAKCNLPAGWPDAEIVLGDETDYSTSWALAGPIIEAECIEWQWLPSSSKDHRYGARKPSLGGLNRTFCMDGPTILVAAMRCYVASKMGDEIEVPEELK
jgi:hypothetical protein